MKTIELNGEKYVKLSEVITTEKAQQLDGLDYVLVRTYSAGVHCGYLKEKSKDKTTCTLLQVRRLWYRDGASSLSQLAMEGVKKPENCKFPCEVREIELVGCVEYIPMTEEARLSVKEVQIWKK